MRSFIVASLATFVVGCQRDFHELLSAPHHFHHARRQDIPKADFPPKLTEEEQVISDSFNNNSIAASSYYYTHGLHVAGTNKSMAQWTADRWAESGFNSRLNEYYVFINYPLSHSMSLDFANGTTYTPSLKEDALPEDDVTTYPNSVPTFHGFSASGDVSAEYVYVGRGQEVDFQRLLALGVELEGRIAIAKYGGPFRGLKVKNSQNHGMIGTVIFTDPSDDGNVTEANGYAAYPDGWARNPSSVQRGSVQFLSTYPGDPTTPGYPSFEDSPRADRSDATPQIPSLPISYQDAIPILAALDGYGVAGAEVNRTGWVGKLNVTYSTGPNPDAVLSFSNQMNDTYTPIWNAIGIINGTHEDEVIVIGNHRDAWIIGGAADPNSGSAVMIELAKAFGNLMKTGWKPKRTIVLASWDMEEYGLVGSTEFVEEYIPWLSKAAVSYLNIDVACSGPVPDFSASPELHDILEATMKKVVWPNLHSADFYPEGQTLYDVWQAYAKGKGEIGVLGSGSDYTAFLHNGISSVDMGAGNGPLDPVYHYHSNYDTYHWMSTFGDPGFGIHTAIGQFLGLLAYHMSTDEIIPYNTTTYTEALGTYLTSLETTLEESECCTDLDLSPLQDAISTFSDAADSIAELKAQAMESGDAGMVSLVNSKYKNFQRGFVSQGGLPDREFYKHVAFAPGLDTGYAPTTYPGITEAVEAGDSDLAEEWVGKTAAGIEAAAAILAV